MGVELFKKFWNSFQNIKFFFKIDLICARLLKIKFELAVLVLVWKLYYLNNDRFRFRGRKKRIN